MAVVGSAPWPAGKSPDPRSQWVLVLERRGVQPALAEGLSEVADGRPPDLELNVVPGRPRPVSPIQDDGLRVALVALVVAPPVAEVDPADERDVLLGAPASSDDGELLVVGAEPADPLVGQHLTARVVHDLADVRVLLLGVPLLVGMRPPHQPAHVDPSPDGLGENRPQFRTWSGQSLPGVASPVEEPHLVPGTEAGQLLVQPGEVGGPVDQRRDGVPLGPASAVPRRRSISEAALPRSSALRNHRSVVDIGPNVSSLPGRRAAREWPRRAQGTTAVNA